MTVHQLGTMNVQDLMEIDQEVQAALQNSGSRLCVPPFIQQHEYK